MIKLLGYLVPSEKYVAGLKALKEAGIIVHPHMTISSLNKDSLMKYPYFCKEIGADRFSANIVIPAGRGSDEELKISYSQIGGLVTALMKEAEKAGVKFMWYSPTPICLFNPLTARLEIKAAVPVRDYCQLTLWEMYCPVQAGQNLWEIFLRKVLNLYGLRKSLNGYGQKKLPLKICKSCKYFVPCQGACPLFILKYMGAGNFIMHGSL